MKKVLQISITLSLILALALPEMSFGALGFSFSMSHRKKLQKITAKQIDEFLNSISEDDRHEVLKAKEDIETINESPLRLFYSKNMSYREDNKNIYLLIPGINYLDDVQEWAEALHALRSSRAITYFSRWSMLETTETIIDLISKEIKWMAKNFKRKQIHIIGYSAGGNLAILAWDKLVAENNIPKNVTVHTIASPLYGFDAPDFFTNIFVGPFLGEVTVQIAKGSYRLFKNASLPQCKHWVTTNCELDINACPTSKKNNPEQIKTGMPCGEENTQYFDNLMHRQMLNYTINSLAKSSLNKK